MADPVPSPVSGSAPFYIQPEPLSFEQHGSLGVRIRPNPYAFASKLHFVPIVAVEFPLAAAVYPIIFAGEERTPLAVLGINEGQNLFFFDNGEARSGAYLPAYVRRYPFTVANDDTNKQMVVCIDRASDLVNEDGEARFFEGQELSEYGKASVEFCEIYERDRGISDSLIRKLIEFDLFEPREVTINVESETPGGEPEKRVIANFFAISEQKLQDLPQDKFLELRPALAPVYAHLASMTHWDRLITMAVEREAENSAAAGKPN